MIRAPRRSSGPTSSVSAKGQASFLDIISLGRIPLAEHYPEAEECDGPQPDPRTGLQLKPCPIEEDDRDEMVPAHCPLAVSTTPLPTGRAPEKGTGGAVGILALPLPWPWHICLFQGSFKSYLKDLFSAGGSGVGQLGYKTVQSPPAPRRHAIRF